MNQSGGLKSVSRSLLAEKRLGHLVELGVEIRHQVIRGVLITLAHCLDGLNKILSCGLGHGLHHSTKKEAD